jgi:uncharacterized Zn finger protein
MSLDGATLMKPFLLSSIRCRSCSPSLLEIRGAYVPEESVRCGSCGAVVTSRPSFFQRVRDPNLPVLDPERQKAIRAEIESEFP